MNGALQSIFGLSNAILNAQNAENQSGLSRVFRYASSFFGHHQDTEYAIVSVPEDSIPSVDDTTQVPEFIRDIKNQYLRRLDNATSNTIHSIIIKPIKNIILHDIDQLRLKCQSLQNEKQVNKLEKKLKNTEKQVKKLTRGQLEGMIDKIPIELVHYIFSLLPMNDLRSLKLSSRGLRDIASDKSIEKEICFRTFPMSYRGQVPLEALRIKFAFMKKIMDFRPEKVVAQSEDMVGNVFYQSQPNTLERAPFPSLPFLVDESNIKMVIENINELDETCIFRGLIPIKDNVVAWGGVNLKEEKVQVFLFENGISKPLSEKFVNELIVRTSINFFGNPYSNPNSKPPFFLHSDSQKKQIYVRKGEYYTIIDLENEQILKRGYPIELREETGCVLKNNVVYFKKDQKIYSHDILEESFQPKIEFDLNTLLDRSTEFIDESQFELYNIIDDYFLFMNKKSEDNWGLYVYEPVKGNVVRIYDLNPLLTPSKGITIANGFVFIATCDSNSISVFDIDKGTLVKSLQLPHTIFSQFNITQREMDSLIEPGKYFRVKDNKLYYYAKEDNGAILHSIEF